MGLFRRRNEVGAVSVRCPSCGHTQNVQKHVLSLYCERCMNRIVTSNGSEPSKLSIKPIASTKDSPGKRIRIDCPHCDSPNEVTPDAVSVFCKNCNGIISLKKDTPAVRSLEAKSADGTTRAVTCYTCSNIQSVSASALSAFCSSCGNRIDLKDWEVKTDYHDKIMTRGKLHVSTTGKVHAEVNVMSAEIDGEVYGNVFAEDKLTIGPVGKVYGNVIAKRMELEKGAFYSGNIRLNADTMGK